MSRLLGLASPAFPEASSGCGPDHYAGARSNSVVVLTRDYVYRHRSCGTAYRLDGACATPHRCRLPLPTGYWYTTAVIFDIVGDIHGHADALVRLLSELGYQQRGGIFRSGSDDRAAIFLGDFIDRGPDIRRVLRIVRGMIDSGNARSVMGNHEYNAICFHTNRHDGDARRPLWLRPRTDKNLFQHVDTLYQFRRRRMELQEYVQWFSSLPLFLDLGNIRVVHAAWNDRDMAVCRQYSSQGNLLTSDFLHATVRSGTPEFAAVETMLKGVELALPEGHSYMDKDGNRRDHIRVAWWKAGSGLRYRDLQFPPSMESDVGEIAITPSEARKVPGYPGSVPVFIGHYWLSETTPVLQSNRVCCLDYSVAKGGSLAAYTWDGESELRVDRITLVPSHDRTAQNEQESRL